MKTRETYTLLYQELLKKKEKKSGEQPVFAVWAFALDKASLKHPRQWQQETRERVAVAKLKPASMKVKKYFLILLFSSPGQSGEVFDQHFHIPLLFVCKPW